MTTMTLERKGIRPATQQAAAPAAEEGRTFYVVTGLLSAVMAVLAVVSLVLMVQVLLRS